MLKILATVMLLVGTAATFGCANVDGTDAAGDVEETVGSTEQTLGESTCWTGTCWSSKGCSSTSTTIGMGGESQSLWSYAELKTDEASICDGAWVYEAKIGSPYADGGIGYGVEAKRVNTETLCESTVLSYRVYVKDAVNGWGATHVARGSVTGKWSYYYATLNSNAKTYYCYFDAFTYFSDIGAGYGDTVRVAAKAMNGAVFQRTGVSFNVGAPIGPL